MDSVFVVTSGDYSDYHIDAIFSTEEKAKEYIKWHELLPYSEDYDISEIKVDEPIFGDTAMSYSFVYDETNIGGVLSCSAMRKNEPGGKPSFTLAVGGKTFTLSPNGLAVIKFVNDHDTSVIEKIAQDKLAEIKYNTAFLEEV